MEKSVFRSILKESSLWRQEVGDKGKGESMPFINARGSYADDAL